MDAPRWGGTRLYRNVGKCEKSLCVENLNDGILGTNKIFIAVMVMRRLGDSFL